MISNKKMDEIYVDKKILSYEQTKRNLKKKCSKILDDSKDSLNTEKFNAKFLEFEKQIKERGPKFEKNMGIIKNIYTSLNSSQQAFFNQGDFTKTPETSEIRDYDIIQCALIYLFMPENQENPVNIDLMSKVSKKISDADLSEFQGQEMEAHKKIFLNLLCIGDFYSLAGRENHDGTESKALSSNIQDSCVKVLMDKKFVEFVEGNDNSSLKYSLQLKLSQFFARKCIFLVDIYNAFFNNPEILEKKIPDSELSSMLKTLFQEGNIIQRSKMYVQNYY